MDTFKKPPAAGGVKSIIKELAYRFFTHNVGPDAAALTYYMLFSLFPIMVLLSLIMSIVGMRELFFNIGFIQVLPEEVVDILSRYMEYVETGDQGRSLLFASFIFTLYFPVRAVNFIIIVVNKAYQVKNSRSMGSRYFLALVLAVIMSVVMFFSFTLITLSGSVVEIIAEYLSVSGWLIEAWGFLRFILLAGLLFSLIAALYYKAPNERIHFRQALPGALAALISWFIVSIIFSFYVSKMGRYSLFYGSIGTMIILLVWLNFGAVSIIMGAELNHVRIERKERKILH